MLKYILPNIPKHRIYVEPFVGGGAVFWAKEPSQVEVVNDINKEVINFYTVSKKHFRSLNTEIQATIHSREQHRQAQVVYDNPDMFSLVKRAWAFWTLANQSFSSIIGGGWGFAKDVSVERRLTAKKRNFIRIYTTRLERVQVECNDAIKVIKSRDIEDAFFYCDPPYFNSDMGHFKGYTVHDFTNLLEILAHIKGKFLLSSYPSEILTKYIQKYKWHSFAIEKKIAVTKLTKRSKTEVLIANYELRKEQ